MRRENSWKLKKGKIEAGRGVRKIKIVGRGMGRK